MRAGTWLGVGMSPFRRWSVPRSKSAAVLCGSGPAVHGPWLQQLLAQVRVDGIGSCWLWRGTLRLHRTMHLGTAAMTDPSSMPSLTVCNLPQGSTMAQLVICCAHKCKKRGAQRSFKLQGHVAQPATTTAGPDSATLEPQSRTVCTHNVQHAHKWSNIKITR